MRNSRSTRNGQWLALVAVLGLGIAMAHAEPPGPPPGPPPQEALDACENLSDGASCSFTASDGGSVSGECHGPQGKPLACGPTGQQPPGPLPGQPPQEAVDACANLSDGASCTVSTDGGTTAGVCQGPQGKPLACVPENQQPPPPPPQEALDACENVTEGDACSVTIQGETLTGTCGAPQGEPLACVPDHLRMPERR